MPSPFFDADFRYVESLDPGERTLVESLKRMHLNDCWMFSTGGQFWTRYMDEHNGRLTTIDNDYTLTRLRLFGDLSFSDKVRVYGEYIYAASFDEELPFAPVDKNFGDIQNLFAEVPLAGCDCHPLFLRVGRQELLLGSQRLVSTLDWVNTRRTFDGARLFRRGEKWDFDLFWTQFVPPRASELDRYDENRDFGGAWLTYRAQKGRFLDFYYLYADNSNSLARKGSSSRPSAPTPWAHAGPGTRTDSCGTRSLLCSSGRGPMRTSWPVPRPSASGATGAKPA